MSAPTEHRLRITEPTPAARAAPACAVSITPSSPELLLLGLTLLAAALLASSGARIPALWPLLATFLMVTLVLRGYPLVLVAPPLALLAAVPGQAGADPAASFEAYLGGFGSHVTHYFPVILLGALFARAMDDSGCASRIALGFASLGTRIATVAIVFACALLVAGGISVFVVAMATVPIGRAVFEARGLPLRLLPAVIALGSFTFAMTSLPGAPTIINAIAASHFGTTALSAPVPSLVAVVVMLGVGLAWIGMRLRRIEGGARSGSLLSLPPDAVSLPAALLPIGFVIVTNGVLSSAWPSGARGVLGLAPALLSLATGILAVLAFHGRRLASLRRTLDQGATQAFGPVCVVASGVGFGTVLVRLPEVAPLLDAAAAAAGDALPLGDIAVRVALLAGLAGSSAGGLDLALSQYGDAALAAVQTTGGDPGLLHRVAALACGTLDTLPHSGAILLLLGIAGETHRRAYGDLFVVTVVGPSLALLVVLAMGAGG